MKKNNDAYIQEVLGLILAPAAERERFAADLRLHLQAAAEEGLTPDQVAARLGSPRVVALEFMAGRALTYAGFWRRSVAFFIDIMVLGLLALVPTVLGVVFSNLVPQHPQSALDYVLGGLLILLVLACILAVLGLVLLYFPLLEGRFGQTIGKRLLRMTVRREDGLPVGYKEAFLRRISYYLEILPFDALVIPFTARKQRAFDMVARTVVVRLPMI
jgi:uncharacterized RDD family membrane protein YckC